jgi:HK97 family phage prohead protease
MKIQCGIMPVKKDYDEDGVRMIKEVKLYEISAVTIAANDEAKILEVKGEYNNPRLPQKEI